MLFDTRKKQLSSVLMFLLYFWMFEMTLGGGGRLVEINDISPRNVIMFIALPISFFCLFNLSGIALFNFICLCGLYLSSVVISILVSLGNVSGDVLNLIIQELKPTSIILIFPLIIYITKHFGYKFFIVIKLSALIMAVVYITSVSLVYFGMIDFSTLYKINGTGEFFFSPSGSYVYKGFVYLSIGALFFLFEKGIANKFFFAVCLLALILCKSRGLMLSFIIVSFLFYFKHYEVSIKKKSVLFLIVPLFMFFSSNHYINNYSERDSVSDNIRLNDFRYITDAIGDDPARILYGFGANVDVNGRNQIENSYVNSLIRQGLLGVLFLLLPIVLIAVNIIGAKTDYRFNLMLAGVLLIYIQSNFNPYINNTIGLFFVLYVLALSIWVKKKDNGSVDNNVL